MISIKKLTAIAAMILTLGVSFAGGAFADSHGGKPVGITPDLMSITVKHNGKDVEIKRNQDNNAVINPAFAKTSRPCPPFCIQPMEVAPNVQTIGEAEVIDYISRMNAGDSSIFIGDSRTSDWVAKGTIPGAVNVSWTSLVPAQGATTDGIIKVMSDHFGVKLAADSDSMDVDEAIVDGDTRSVFDYRDAKTLVLFCNGMWCGQSPASIRALLKYGYPAEKIKYFRGGMQTWEILGLSTAKP